MIRYLSVSLALPPINRIEVIALLKSMNSRISLILLVIAVVYLILSYQLPSYAYTEVDADAIPKALGWLLVFLAILLFFSKDNETEEQRQKRNIPKKEIGMLLGVGALIFLYIFLLEILGFIVVSALFIFFCSIFLGYKSHIVNGIVSVAFSAFIYFIFTSLLQISLPSGILPL
ncbi:tripartite tricarboxylate transporter TctB family protein [Oceanobacillus sojae]|uniref:tripartite tricarboxylate transporter TctB family protein n=1 Tax=Oceanobacillus sojae TaxID=582851 RepID=UPI0034C5FB11